jgi:ACS family hexuronate transporter-like MFS transporter
VGFTVDRARKVALGCCAVAMPAVMLVSIAPVSVALALFSVAFLRSKRGRA